MVTAFSAAPIRALIVEDNRDICANVATYLEKGIGSIKPFFGKSACNAVGFRAEVCS